MLIRPLIMATKRQLLDKLIAAYAMECAMAEVLKTHIKNSSIPAPLQEELKVHLVQTFRHAQLVDECLKDFGQDRRACPAPSQKPLAPALHPLSLRAREPGEHAFLEAYALTQFEIDSYRSIIADSQSLSLTRIAARCMEIVGEEQMLARWIEQQVPEAIAHYRQEENGPVTPNSTSLAVGPASEEDTSTRHDGEALSLLVR